MGINYEMPEIKRSSRYTVGQAAKVLGVHRNTLCGYCNQGLIKFTFRVGKKKLIMGHELIRFWAEKHVKAFGKI
ncbi:MAG: helix-turn-helix domain-containing protein [Muribaculum sp.]|nr:helix-turn-helix domain-containing protein [Muribaculum sp.]